MRNGVLREFLNGLGNGWARLSGRSPYRRRRVGEFIFRSNPSPSRALRRALLILGGLFLTTTLFISATGNAAPLNPDLPAARIPNPQHEAGAQSMPAQTPPLTEEALAADSGAPVRVWTAIVLHHSATLRGSAASFDAYHRQERGWRSLGYHFVIGNGTDTADGEVEAGPRWRRQEAGAHAHSSEFNERGIGICLVGNFELREPSEAQVQAVADLCKRLCAKFGIPPSRIYGHGGIREGGSTVCPGRFFPLERIRKTAGE
ncbi:MAG: peptidoglycan recognition protein family protein [Planctomycetota bacterium]|nr:peptidoglycan recognition protein family protein [Planctomycetota bacterium]